MGIITIRCAVCGENIDRDIYNFFKDGNKFTVSSVESYAALLVGEKNMNSNMKAQKFMAHIKHSNYEWERIVDVFNPALIFYRYILPGKQLTFDMPIKTKQ